jgi:hypothetical protein
MRRFWCTNVPPYVASHPTRRATILYNYLNFTQTALNGPSRVSISSFALSTSLDPAFTQISGSLRPQCLKVPLPEFALLTLACSYTSDILQSSSRTGLSQFSVVTPFVQTSFLALPSVVDMYAGIPCRCVELVPPLDSLPQLVGHGACSVYPRQVPDVADLGAGCFKPCGLASVVASRAAPGIVGIRDGPKTGSRRIYIYTDQSSARLDSV